MKKIQNDLTRGAFSKTSCGIIDAVLGRVCQVKSSGVSTHSNGHAILGKSILHKPDIQIKNGNDERRINRSNHKDKIRKTDQFAACSTFMILFFPWSAL